jgi:hypothetical protein
MQTLPANFRSGDELEKGVLSELHGNKAPRNFSESLKWYEATLVQADALAARLSELRAIGKKSTLLPEFEAALSKVLADHPPIERVSRTMARYSNLGQGRQVDRHLDKFGQNLDEVLASIQQDLNLVRDNLRETIKEFRNVSEVARDGGLAALILSGRASFPELVMQGEDMMTAFIRFYGLACMTTIVATMQVYPKGLEFLPQPKRK